MSVASVTKRGSKYWVRWRERGRGGVNRSVSVSTKRDAERLKGKIQEAVERHGRYDHEPARAGSATPLAQVLDDYITDSKRRHARGTTRSYAQHLLLFRKWAGPITV